jgi:hypothetical protein
VTFGVPAAWIPRDVIDDVVRTHGKQPKRSDSKQPAHLMVLYACVLALYADDDYEQVMTQLTERIRELGGWSHTWEEPTSGGITRARKRLGFEVVRDVYDQMAEPAGTCSLPPGAAKKAAARRRKAAQVAAFSSSWISL